MLEVAPVLMLAVGNADVSLKLMSWSTPASQQPAPAMYVVTPMQVPCQRESSLKDFENQEPGGGLPMSGVGYTSRRTMRTPKAVW